MILVTYRGYSAARLAETAPSYKMFKGGARVSSHSGRSCPVFNPAKGAERGTDAVQSYVRVKNVSLSLD